MTMTVGEAATAAGVSAKAIRLWEAKGLLPPAQRTDAGYRVFDDNDLAVLRFIRQAKSLDLTLDEIKDVLDLQAAGHVPCALVTELLDQHIARIDRTITELTALRGNLDRARSSAWEERNRGRTTLVCSIIEHAPLDHASSGADQRGRRTKRGRSLRGSQVEEHQ